MIEKIYTIPVNDAYNSDCTCPLCSLRDKAESDYVEYYLGPSLMEPDTRKLTNKSGFCPEHLGKLNLKEANRLGLALMLHTHLLDVKSDLSGKISRSIPDKCGTFKGRSSDYKNKLSELSKYIDERTDNCLICEKINYSMKRYIEVIFWMFSHDDNFRELFTKKCGYCLPHLSMLLKAASSSLSQNEASDLMNVIAGGFNNEMATLTSDVEWFTLKFDYRNKDKPWGNSKNAIQRAMCFLAGKRSDFDETK